MHRAPWLLRKLRGTQPTTFTFREGQTKEAFNRQLTLLKQSITAYHEIGDSGRMEELLELKARVTGDRHIEGCEQACYAGDYDQALHELEKANSCFQGLGMCSSTRSFDAGPNTYMRLGAKLSTNRPGVLGRPGSAMVSSSSTGQLGARGKRARGVESNVHLLHGQIASAQSILELCVVSEGIGASA